MTALKFGGLVLKEEQKAALYAITLKKQDCLCILPTGLESPLIFNLFLLLWTALRKSVTAAFSCCFSAESHHIGSNQEMKRKRCRCQSPEER